MGIILGRANGIGVAPAARWIACRGLNHQGSGSEANLLRCGQWITTANPRPNVVSNSWGGGTGDPWFNDVIRVWRAAGIVPVFASGSSPGDQTGVISVGYHCRDKVQSSVSFPGHIFQSPTISAPGCDITSSGTGAGNYVTASGTTKSVPHVAGKFAKYISRHL